MLLDRFLQIREHYRKLEDEMSLSEVVSDKRRLAKVGREYNRLRKLIPLLDEYERNTRDLSDNRDIVDFESDDDLKKLALDEIPRLEERLAFLHLKLLEGLLPVDPNEGRNVIVEVRAGTGGDAAALFAGDLFRMYIRLAERQGFRYEILNENLPILVVIKKSSLFLKGMIHTTISNMKVEFTESKESRKQKLQEEFTPLLHLY
jgi:peptide chain release factor 1